MPTDEKSDLSKFYAPLRPYRVAELDDLLHTLRDGNALGLGRTKLHQIREAVLKMNLTTSVSEGIAVLGNWRGKQRAFVEDYVRKMGNERQQQYRNEEEPGTMFPRVTFPWFADGPDTYRTPLLDFVELYDFVRQGGEEEHGN